MSNELATTQPNTSMFATADLFALVQRQATMIAASDLLPKQFQGNVPNCAIALEMASRLGASPFAVIQNMYVVHGRPSWSAVFLMGMVNSCGRFTPLQYRIEVTGKEKTIDLVIEGWDPAVKGKRISRKQPYTYTPTRCVAWAKSKVDGEVVEGPPVSYDMALEEGWVAKDGSKWQTEMREVMLRYRAAAFFAKVHASDITLGMQTREEAEDSGPAMRNVTPPEVGEAIASSLATEIKDLNDNSQAKLRRATRPAPQKEVEAQSVETQEPEAQPEPGPTAEEQDAAMKHRKTVITKIGSEFKRRGIKREQADAHLKAVGWLGYDTLGDCTTEELEALVADFSILDGAEALPSAPAA